MNDSNIISLDSLESYQRIDPEYYKKKYFKNLQNLEKNKSTPLSSFVKLRKEKFKKNFDKFNYIEISGIDTLTGALEHSSVYTIDAPSRAQNVLKKGDLIVSFVRPNRKALSIVPEEQDNFIGTSGLGVYEVEGIDPQYLLAYLKTDLINELVSRKATATEYPAISHDDFITTPIIVFEKIKKQVTDLVVKSQEHIKNFKAQYKLAENKLYRIVNFEEYFENSKTRFLNFKDISDDKSYRIDPKFFCTQIINFINKLKLKGDVVEIKDLILKKINRGVSPDYDPNGNVVLVNSEHLGLNGLNYGATDRVSSNFFINNQKAIIEFEDVLVYATGLYYGRTNIYLQNEKTLAGLDVLIIKFNKKLCDPYYASLYLNSNIGLLISKKYFSGSAQEHLYDYHLDSYPIFIPKDKKLVNEISELVKISDNEKYLAYKNLNQAIKLIDKELYAINNF